MNAATMSETVLLGAVTGMRSMSGAAAVARRYGGMLQTVTSVMAMGEMLVDKTSFVGDRTDALPLAGRALMGAVVGGALAHEEEGNLLVGGLLGATAAVIGAHLGHRLRTRARINGTVAGLIEDAVVFGVGTMLARRRPA